MKMNKPPVSSSVGIKIELPDNYSVSGDTEIKPKEEVRKNPKDETDEQFLELLYQHLEQLEQQKQITVNMINMVKKRLGFCCGKDKR